MREDDQDPRRPPAGRAAARRRGAASDPAVGRRRRGRVRFRPPPPEPEETRAPFRGFGVGFRGGALRSRGSYHAGQLRSGLNPEDEFGFRWGEGYVGGRGYGGTNYDLRHGYATRASERGRAADGRERARRAARTAGPAAPGRSTRGGYEWGEEYRRLQRETHGPARYGYGPYHDRLRRRRRPDEEVEADVRETLFYDTWIDADRIEVGVENGIVLLKGTLRSFDEVRYATDDAWDVDGVVGVRSELRVDEAEAGGAVAEPAAGDRPSAGDVWASGGSAAGPAGPVGDEQGGGGGRGEESAARREPRETSEGGAG